MYLKLGFQNINELNERINFKIYGKELLKNIEFLTDRIRWFTALTAGFTPIGVVAELTNIGTLAAFIVVSISGR